MKFTLPIQKADNLLAGLRYEGATWESRLAKIAVVTQAVSGGIVLAWNWRLLPPEIPLWYSKPWGEERLVSPFFLAIPILTAFAVYAVNHSMVTRTARDHPMFARVLSLSSLLISILSAIIVIRIVTLIS
ncbi:hypothetical protein HZB58_00755 [Candidatus Gottesmanbacteria bacterium]|nr:hypothetical protein [Candidatus Gottesmanbacteria bacterium]